MKQWLQTGALALTILIAAVVCRADIVFDLSPASSTVNRGGLIQFFASVINTGPLDVTLDSLSATFLPDLDRTEDFTPFFTNFFGVLPAGSSIPNAGSPLEIYDLGVNLTAVPGDYAGLLTLNDDMGNAVAEQTFTVHVTPNALPEPGEFVLYGVGLVGIVAWKRRRNIQSLSQTI